MRAAQRFPPSLTPIAGMRETSVPDPPARQLTAVVTKIRWPLLLVLASLAAVSSVCAGLVCLLGLHRDRHLV
jgi:hypothetical protein